MVIREKKSMCIARMLSFVLENKKMGFRLKKLAHKSLDKQTKPCGSAIYQRRVNMGLAVVKRIRILKRLFPI